MGQDRRRRRAVAPLLAAEYYLDCERERALASELVLVDGDDVLVRTGARSGDEGDEYVHALEVGGRKLVLRSYDRRVRSVRSVEQGLGRILAG